MRNFSVLAEKSFTISFYEERKEDSETSTLMELEDDSRNLREL